MNQRTADILGVLLLIFIVGICLSFALGRMERTPEIEPRPYESHHPTQYPPFLPDWNPLP